MQRIEGNQLPMIEDNPENTLQPVPTRRYFTFFSRQAIELLAVGAGMVALGVSIQGQRKINEQSKIIEDLQYRLSNLELDLKQEHSVCKQNILYQHSQTGSCLQMKKLLNELNKAVIAGDNSIKNTLLFTNKQVFKSIPIDKKQTLSSALIRVLNAFEKIESACQFPMIEDNPENTLQPVLTRRYFTFFSRQAIELLAVGAGVASLGIAIQSQRTISEQNKVIEDLQYRVSNLELDNYKNIYNYPSAAKKSTSNRAANLLEKLREAKTNIDKIQLLHANKDNIKIFSAAEQNQVMELISGDMVDPVIFSYFSDSSVKAKLASKEVHYRAKNNLF